MSARPDGGERVRMSRLQEIVSDVDVTKRYR